MTLPDRALPRLDSADENTPTQVDPRGLLLVDDDRLVLATLKQGLTRMGYAVTACDNGQDALEHYTRETPDLVILDVRMPGMSGIDTARAMLEAAYRPILMLSAHDDQNLVKEAVSIGVAGYLVKPIEANQMAPSIEAALARFAEVNALLSDREALRRQARLNAAALELSRCVGLDETLRAVLTGAMDLTGADMGAVALYDDQTDRFIRWVSKGVCADLQDVQMHATAQDDRDALPDPLLVPALALEALMRMRGACASLCLPIVFGRIRLGTVLLYSRSRDAFSRPQRELANVYAHLCAQALDNVRLHAEIARLAWTDSLTGLGNRRLAEERLRQEFLRAKRYASPFSIVLLDIDRFGRINEGYGHAAGDAVLKEFSRLLAHGIRDVDVPVRYGGDQFMLILPHTYGPGAVFLTQRLRRTLSRRSFRLSESADSLTLTISAGIAAYRRVLAGFPELVACADHALRAAKDAGGDCALLYGTLHV